MHTQLLKRIQSQETTIAIVGLGYVGLPLAVEFAAKGYSVLGIENNAKRATAVNDGVSYINDVKADALKAVVSRGKLRASTGFEAVAEADVVIICVPTPLNKNKEPDISYIVRSTDEVANRLRKNCLVILESTTYPGTTEDIVLKALRAKGFKEGQDVFVAFSPERVDPGNARFHTATTPKVVGGMTPACLELTQTLYSQVVSSVVPVSSPRVAEMTKVFENVYRSVNIALVNELAQLCESMDIDVYEVITAAATKPYGYQAFWPGPGVGGHCIPLDPYYLAWKGKEFDIHARFIELAGEINERQPRLVAAKASQLLNARGKPLNGSKILQLGATYKKDIEDARESPAVAVYEQLTLAGAQVEVVDPWADRFWIRSHDETYGNAGPPVKTVQLTDARLREADLVLLVTDHTQFPYAKIAELAPMIFDTRNAFGVRGFKQSHIFTLSTQVPRAERKSP